MTGRQEGENFSRLCKRRLLARFCGLLDNLPTITEVDAGAVKCLSYGEIKALAADYQVNANKRPLKYYRIALPVSYHI